MTNHISLYIWDFMFHYDNLLTETAILDLQEDGSY